MGRTSLGPILAPTRRVESPSPFLLDVHGYAILVGGMIGVNSAGGRPQGKRGDIVLEHRTEMRLGPPQGILAAESGLTPARALLDHRQARFAYRLHAKPQARDGGGPEEILGRQGTALARRLRAAAALRPGAAVEA